MRKFFAVHSVWDCSAPGAGFILTILDRKDFGASFTNRRKLSPTRGLGPFQLRELVLVLTIWDREALGAGFSNKWKLCSTRGLGLFSSGAWF